MYLQFFPWIWDDQAAWEKAVADPRYAYDAPIDHLIALYNEYRNIPDPEKKDDFYFTNNEIDKALTAAEATVPPPPPAEVEEGPGLLSQTEIDALLKSV